VGVNLGGRAHRGVPETFGDRQEVHAFVQQVARVAVAQDVKRRMALWLILNAIWKSKMGIPG
jgi:hypothetical protein